MATEEGIVTHIESDAMAWVKTSKSSACKACSASGSCTAMGSEMKVQALNIAGAREGDRIKLSFENASLLKATFLLYVFPILCLISGAFVGQGIAANYRWNESAVAALAGFLCFLAAVLFVKIRANQMAKSDSYRPKIVSVLKQS